MRLESGIGWVEITFDHYAEDAVCGYCAELYDPHNAVEIGFDYSIKDIGWGCVGDEYFMTWDIVALSKGFEEIQHSLSNEFSYSAQLPYNKDFEFYSFKITRTALEITFTLRIYNGLSEYISISKLFTNKAFADIVDEFEKAAKQFPVR